MTRELEVMLATLVRSAGFAERMVPLVQALLLAQLLAAAGHDGPPHRAQRVSRGTAPRRHRPLPRRGSVAGRRPRG